MLVGCRKNLLMRTSSGGASASWLSQATTGVAGLSIRSEYGGITKRIRLSSRPSEFPLESPMPSADGDEPFSDTAAAATSAFVTASGCCNWCWIRERKSTGACTTGKVRSSFRAPCISARSLRQDAHCARCSWISAVASSGETVSEFWNISPSPWRQVLHEIFMSMGWHNYCCFRSDKRIMRPALFWPFYSSKSSLALSSSLRNCIRARLMRLLTVPSGSFSDCEISSYEWPSMSKSTSTKR